LLDLSHRLINPLGQLKCVGSRLFLNRNDHGRFGIDRRVPDLLRGRNLNVCDIPDGYRNIVSLGDDGLFKVLNRIGAADSPDGVLLAV
jgi:hypothetical protein